MFDLRPFYQRNSKYNLKTAEKWLRWWLYIMLLSTGIKSTEEHPVTKFNVILDGEGFRLERSGFYNVRCKHEIHNANLITGNYCI